jgi:hypothetical protein
MYKNRGARLLASRVPRARARVIISSFVFFACCIGGGEEMGGQALACSGRAEHPAARAHARETRTPHRHARTRSLHTHGSAFRMPPHIRRHPERDQTRPIATTICKCTKVRSRQRGGQPGRPARETTTAAPAEPFHLGVTHASPTHRTRCREGRAAIRHPKCTARDRATCAFLAVRRAPKPKALVCLRRLPCFRARRGVAS